jgi:competence protein ComGC
MYGTFGAYTRWAVVFLIIFVLLFLFIPTVVPTQTTC